MRTMQSTVYWINADLIKPDADLAVLLDYDGEVWPGIYDGEQWRDLTGMPIVAQVLNWADFPAPPPVVRAAKEAA